MKEMESGGTSVLECAAVTPVDPKFQEEMFVTTHNTVCAM